MLAVPTFHPSFLLRSADEGGSAKYYDTVVHDLIRAKEYLSRSPNWDEREIWKRDQTGRYVNLYPPSVQYVYDFCREAQGHQLSIDIEATGTDLWACDLICIGMASANGRVLCVPFMRGGGDHFGRYWTSGDERRVREALAWLFADAETPKIFQNGAFDTTKLWLEGMPIEGWRDDTMQAQHVLDGEMPMRLDFIASRRVEIPYWKDDVKGGQRWLDIDPRVLRGYNLRDALVVLKAFPGMLEEMRRWGLEDLYRTEMQLVHVMRKATWAGIEFDPVRVYSEEIVTEALLADTAHAKRLGVVARDLGWPAGFVPRMRKLGADNLAILREIAGHSEFNPGSYDQLAWFLYDKLGFPVVKRSEKTDKPSTDKTALILLTVYAETAAQKAALGALARVRKATKYLGVFEGFSLHDWRLHPSWKLTTVTGRFASSPNVQNWNEWYKKLACAGEGNMFVSVDLSQAELRMMAYYASARELLRMYEENINVHTATCCLTFQCQAPSESLITTDVNEQTLAYLREKCPQYLGRPYDELDRVDEGSKAATKTAWKTMRTLTKNEEFGDNYGASVDTLFDVIRSKRNPITDEAPFANIERGQIQAFKLFWEEVHHEIPTWWANMTEHVNAQGYYRGPISRRIRWFRGGFARNEILNQPIQEQIAAHMQRIVEVAGYLEEATGDEAVITLQVHDSPVVQTPVRFTDVVGEILMYVFNQPFDWNPPPPFERVPNAVLPADAPTVGYYLNEV